MSFVDGLSRANREGPFLVAPFDDGDAEILAGSTVLGELPPDDGKTPYVDMGQRHHRLQDVLASAVPGRV